MSVGVAVLLPKGSHGSSKLCLDVGLSLGRSHAVVDVESSSNDEMSASTDEGRSDCTSEEVSTSNCNPNNPCFTNSSRRGGGSSVIFPDSDNNNKNAVEEAKLRLPSSQYKGVVPQPNGRWGAQIYEKHQRVWLGTFNTEEDAARTYDRAALKLRGHHAMTNFAPVDDAHPEALFLRRHSKPEIVNMLRKHTYDEELEQSTKDGKISSDSDDPKAAASNPATAAAADWASSPRELLFEKTVTPSDVGKLNRLVIPKHHAQKYFPLDVTGAEKGLVLNFEDSAAKTWRFRYSYWHSSQSYVLTKGWSRYVKAKRLQAGDVVTVDRSTGAARQLYISFRRRPCNFVAPAASGGPLRGPQFFSPVSGYCLAPPVQGHPVLWAYGFPTPPSASNDGKSLEVDVREKTTKSPTSSFSPPSVKLFGVNLS